MQEKDWLDVVTALASIATPALVLIISAIGWKIKQDFERRINIEDKLRDDRIEIYNKILEPFIIILMSDDAWKTNKINRGRNKEDVATTEMLSIDYRRASFQLALMADDNVVKSFNNIMQYFYNMEDNQSASDHDFMTEMMKLLGTLLIEIRKSMGNETTKLNHWDMCEFWLSDARKIKNGQLDLKN